jgi:hypothetical protein
MSPTKDYANKFLYGQYISPSLLDPLFHFNIISYEDLKKKSRTSFIYQYRRFSKTFYAQKIISFYPSLTFDIYFYFQMYIFITKAY